MEYKVELSEQALKSLKKIDRHQVKIIFGWIEKNLAGCQNPRMHGKALVGKQKGHWRYRVGAYRIIADIQDERVRILLVNIAHRREVYD